MLDCTLTSAINIIRAPSSNHGHLNCEDLSRTQVILFNFSQAVKGVTVILYLNLQKKILKRTKNRKVESEKSEGRLNNPPWSFTCKIAPPLFFINPWALILQTTKWRMHAYLFPCACKEPFLSSFFLIVSFLSFFFFFLLYQITSGVRCYNLRGPRIDTGHLSETRVPTPLSYQCAGAFKAPFVLQRYWLFY